MKQIKIPVQKTKGHCSMCQKPFPKDSFGLDDYVQAPYNGQPICRECRKITDDLP